MARLKDVTSAESREADRRRAFLIYLIAGVVAAGATVALYFL